MLRSGLLTIHPLPNEAGSAADRSTFFLLNGVVKDLRAFHAEPGGVTADLLKKIEPQIKMADLGWLEAG